MATSDGPPTPALALREAFGDRKPPDITRKITACVACRKQKIKCHMNDGQPPCTRCRKRGLPCTVNKSLQMLLETDVTWKSAMEDRLASLEDTISDLKTSKVPLPEPLFPIANSQDRPTPDRAFDPSGALSPSMLNTIDPASRQAQPQSRFEVVVDTRGPAVIPASVVSELSSPPIKYTQPGVPGLSRYGGDLVTRGLISLATAEEMFAIYSQRLDHFLYRILGDHTTLASVREASSLMTAAICAVGALAARSAVYETCRMAFLNQAAVHSFSSQHNEDDIRGYLIGAFWLSDVSWPLVGTAARIATEINLHRAISKPSSMTRDQYLRARVFLLVFVCDHHFSITYGRTPLTHGFLALMTPRALLDSPFADEDDARLVSQVEIWSISQDVFDCFKLDTDTPIPDPLFPQLRRFAIALDTWRADWDERFMVSNFVGNYPKKGVGLHYHFAKLYLCSHVFRGSAQSDGVSGSTLPDRQEFASLAIQCATAILRFIVSDVEIQLHLEGLPTYFDTMIAFAFVFLLKVASKGSELIRVDQSEVLKLLDQLAIVLKNVTSGMHPQHILTSIANSTGKLLDRSRRSNTDVVGAEAPSRSSGNNQGSADYNWMLSPSDNMFLENFDFLFQQDGDLNFDFNELDRIMQVT